MAIPVGSIADRVLGYLPRFVGKTWSDSTAQELDRVLRKLWHAKSGIPGGFLARVPRPTGKVGDAGTRDASWMAADSIVPQGIVTTKGDVLTHDGTTAERLPVGSNDQILTAASAQTTGLLWQDLSALNDAWTKHFFFSGSM